MKFIVFQNINAVVSNEGYCNSIKICYFLNVNVASLGIDEMVYFGFESSKKFPFHQKMKHLKNMLETDEDRVSINTAIENVKESSKLKNRSSQQIIATTKLKKNLEVIFDTRIEQFNLMLDDKFDIERLKPLINENTFYFYSTLETDSKNSYVVSVSIPEILRLQLPDPEKGNPLFFLNIEYLGGEKILDFNIFSANDPAAENKDNFYGVDSFTFPILEMLSSYELIAVRNQLEEPTREFREKMEEWASICYENPNTNLGLAFFKKHLQQLLSSYENKAYESPIINNALGLTNKKSITQIIIGEAPIQKIWEIYKISNTITDEVYDDLLKVKATQFPKFEGRWPVVILKSLFTDQDEDDSEENQTVKSIRKSISLD
jgi:hypothetical protein